MSIIYDALQKTQRHLDNNKGQFHSELRKRNWFDIALYGIIVLLFIAILFAYYPKFKSYLTHTKAQPVPIKVKAKIKVKPINPTPRHVEAPKNLTLNGTFLSDIEKVALINNSLYKVGDSINGNKIVSINSKKVTLETNGTIFDLENPS